jgi:hypothetical protein
VVVPLLAVMPPMPLEVVVVGDAVVDVPSVPLEHAWDAIPIATNPPVRAAYRECDTFLRINPPPKGPKTKS